jgi:hypothetical protein
MVRHFLIGADDFEVTGKVKEPLEGFGGSVAGGRFFQILQIFPQTAMRNIVKDFLPLFPDPGGTVGDPS